MAFFSRFFAQNTWMTYRGRQKLIPMLTFFGFFNVYVNFLPYMLKNPWAEGSDLSLRARPAIHAERSGDGSRIKSGMTLSELTLCPSRPSRVSPRQASYLSLSRQRNLTERKATRRLGPFASLQATCAARLRRQSKQLACGSDKFGLTFRLRLRCSAQPQRVGE